MTAQMAALCALVRPHCFMGGLRLLVPGKFRCVASFPFPRRHQSPTTLAGVLALSNLHSVVTCAVFVVVACAAAQEDLWPNLVLLMWVPCQCLRIAWYWWLGFPLHSGELHCILRGGLPPPPILSCMCLPTILSHWSLSKAHSSTSSSWPPCCSQPRLQFRCCGGKTVLFSRRCSVSIAHLPIASTLSH